MLAAIYCRQIAPGRCGHCDRTVLFSRRLALPDHRLHALLSLLTGGLWIVGWIVCVLRSAEPIWECQECGRLISTRDMNDMRLAVVHELDFSPSRLAVCPTADDELPSRALAAVGELETGPAAGQARI